MCAKKCQSLIASGWPSKHNSHVTSAGLGDSVGCHSSCMFFDQPYNSIYNIQVLQLQDILGWQTPLIQGNFGKGKLEEHQRVWLKIKARFERKQRDKDAPTKPRTAGIIPLNAGTRWLRNATSFVDVCIVVLENPIHGHSGYTISTMELGPNYQTNLLIQHFS